MVNSIPRWPKTKEPPPIWPQIRGKMTKKAALCHKSKPKCKCGHDTQRLLQAIEKLDPKLESKCQEINEDFSEKN